MDQNIGEIKAIEFAKTQGLSPSSDDTHIYGRGRKMLKKGPCELTKSYTPDISMLIKGVPHWAEFKGFRHVFTPKGHFSKRDDRGYEKKPIIVSFCIDNGIVFKEFKSNKEGYTAFIEGLLEKMG